MEVEEGGNYKERSVTAWFHYVRRKFFVPKRQFNALGQPRFPAPRDQGSPPFFDSPTLSRLSTVSNV